jgi:hypothetical protein
MEDSSSWEASTRFSKTRRKHIWEAVHTKGLQHLQCTCKLSPKSERRRIIAVCKTLPEASSDGMIPAESACERWTQQWPHPLHPESAETISGHTLKEWTGIIFLFDLQLFINSGGACVTFFKSFLPNFEAEWRENFGNWVAYMHRTSASMTHNHES